MTHSDLHALTFAALEGQCETEGAGRHRGIRYRTATYAAKADDGQEHLYSVQVSSRGTVKTKDLGITSEQRQQAVQAMYDALRPNTKKAIKALEMPFANLLQKAAVGNAMEGHPHLPTLRAVLGGASRGDRLLELFPNVATIDEAAAALQEFAAEIASRVSDHKDVIES